MLITSLTKDNRVSINSYRRNFKPIYRVFVSRYILVDHVNPTTKATKKAEHKMGGVGYDFYYMSEVVDFIKKAIDRGVPVRPDIFERLSEVELRLKEYSWLS